MDTLLESWLKVVIEFCRYEVGNGDQREHGEDSALNRVDAKFLGHGRVGIEIAEPFGNSHNNQVALV
jgi:hypothetical protein